MIFEVQTTRKVPASHPFPNSDVCSLNISIPLQSSIIMTIPAEDIRSSKTFVSSTKAEAKHTFGVRN